MYKRNILFVVGAGASADLNFKVGRTLKTAIAELLKPSFQTVKENQATLSRKTLGDSKFTQFLEHYCHSLDNSLKIGNVNLNPAIARSAELICSGLPYSPSVDNFIKNRGDDPLIVACAKAAIAWLILAGESEASRALAAGTDNRGQGYTPGDAQLDGLWYQIFAEQLFSGVERRGMERNEINDALKRISIVSFNYDRCIEQVILIAIQGLFGLTFAEAEIHAKQLQILHPYGDVGSIYSDGQRQTIPFGSHDKRFDDRSLQIFLAACKSIKTFYEEPAIKAGMTRAVDAADRIVFLGFGYHNQNLRLLMPTDSTREKPRKLFGTTLGNAENAEQALRERLLKMFPGVNSKTTLHGELFLKGQTCFQFLDEHQQLLLE